MMRQEPCSESSNRKEDTQSVCPSVCQSTFRSSKEFLRAAFIKKKQAQQVLWLRKGVLLGFFYGVL